MFTFTSQLEDNQTESLLFPSSIAKFATCSSPEFAPSFASLPMDYNPSTPSSNGQRTLAAVVFTDAVGFSARMCQDEAHTLDLIRRDLGLMRQICNQFNGRVLKSTGDGLLMCFPSAVMAVECAIEIQRNLAEATQTLTSRDALQHRVGIHLGDIFICDTDVMGNGVNIAARLQAQAEPGGICISQTVYDVVKTGLTLGTAYLGPRELKNIREVVPIYKICLPFQAQPTDIYDEAVQRLQAQPSFARLKKLLFYVCKHHWETDTVRLDSLDLKGLVQELHQKAPNPETLQRLLQNSVATLTKQAEYHLVANILVQQLTCLYATQGSGTADLSPADSFSPESCARVAQLLEQHPNVARIKKLLFYACQQRWESDPNQLATVSMAALVTELRQRHSSSASISQQLDGLVKTLSRPQEYGQLAAVVVEAIGPLYGDRSTLPEVPLPPVESVPEPITPNVPEALYQQAAQSLASHANLTRIKKLLLCVCHNRWENDTAQLDRLDLVEVLRQVRRLAPEIHHLQARLDGIVKTLNKQMEYALVANLILEKLAILYSSKNGDTPFTTPDLQDGETAAPAILDVPPNPSISLADTRLVIMKFTNPLRAKILLFSSLHHPFSDSPQDWLTLRTHDLDGLLRSLLATCPTVDALNSRLQLAAQSLPEPDDYLQTASTLGKAVRPLYQPRSLKQVPRRSDEPTQFLSDPPGQTRWLDSGSSEDQTCQVLPPAQQRDSPTQLINASSNPGEQTGQLFPRPHTVGSDSTQINAGSDLLSSPPLGNNS